MAKKFESYKTKLNALVKALQGQHAAMKQLNESRLLVSVFDFCMYKESFGGFSNHSTHREHFVIFMVHQVAECLGELSKQSPLSGCAGFKRTNEEIQSEDGFAHVDDEHIHAESDQNTFSCATPSFYSTHQSVFARRQCTSHFSFLHGCFINEVKRFLCC